ncbi:MAG: alpha/beta fold hydrolase [Microbacteriaceae bacterium]
MSAALIERWYRAADGAVLHAEGSRGGVRSTRTVVLLHGLGYASWAAAPLRASLGANIGLWSLENRGTGASTSGTAAFDIALFAEDAAGFIEQLEAPVVLVGYSMGGYIAQLLALTRPELLAGLVLIGTSAGGDRATPVPQSTRTAWLDAADDAPASFIRRTMPLSFRNGWRDAHPDAYEQLLTARLENPTPADVWSAQYDACERFLAVGAPVERITTPTLILHGSADRVLPIENGRAIASALPEQEYLEVTDGGHLLHIEEPHLITDRLRGLLT